MDEREGEIVVVCGGRVCERVWVIKEEEEEEEEEETSEYFDS